jgi:hypothetical protein
MLLASTGRPDDLLDLLNLSADFDGMTAAEFDCWLSATPNSAYRPRHIAKRADIETLGGIPELGPLRRDLGRLQVVLDV